MFLYIYIVEKILILKQYKHVDASFVGDPCLAVCLLLNTEDLLSELVNGQSEANFHCTATFLFSSPFMIRFSRLQKLYMLLSSEKRFNDID